MRDENPPKYPVWSRCGRFVFSVRQVAVEPSGSGHVFHAIFGLFRLDTDTGQVQRLSERAVLPDRPALSPDGKKVAVVFRDSDGSADVFLVDAVSGEFVRGTSGLSATGGLAWSPDGKFLALTTARREATDRAELRVLDLASKELRTIGEVRGSISELSWWQNAQTLLAVVAQSGAERYVAKVATNGEVTRLSADFTECSRPQHFIRSPK
jgi:Tol biopolymer transport system component